MRANLPELVNRYMETNEDVYLLLGDIGVFGFSKSMNQFPKRSLNLGIAEQASIGIAAGLSREGNYPIFHTIAPFMVDRAFEQIKVDFGYSKQSALFVSVGASFDYGKLGGTHHCPEDVSLLSSVEGIEIYLPGSAAEMEKAFKDAVDFRQFAYLRLESNSHPSGLEYLNGQVFDFGNNGTIIAVSYLLETSIEVAKELGMKVQYLNQISNKVKDSHSQYSSDVFIVEPLMTGSTRTALERSGTSFNGRVRSLGVPREFRRDYVDQREHLIKSGLEYNAMLEKISQYL
jgi:transketolase